MDKDYTQKVIDTIKNSPQCMASVRQVPCNDYKARFGAFIRAKYGIISINIIDWTKVAQTIEPLL
jgi:hypothetical protein